MTIAVASSLLHRRCCCRTHCMLLRNSTVYRSSRRFALGTSVLWVAEGAKSRPFKNPWFHHRKRWRRQLCREREVTTATTG
ncbi:hypothetical protein GALMADRAFT_1292592 [Galerina marginata CBS 339.88]|uniref:Uncharacterized protein n=1 Tax=Galerina marginata (strain CBS 339.88) TaxID=685588 RepID=A0A067T695_GALM3|nr:hypothetical protein GALMADRAFT_1292592 [Galerina marginata CBS 339.88]